MWIPRRPFSAAICGGAVMFIIALIMGLMFAIGTLNDNGAFDSYFEKLGLLVPICIFFTWGLVAPAHGWNPILYGIVAAAVYVLTLFGLLELIAKPIFSHYQ